MGIEIMSMFQPSLKNLAKAEERRLDLHENGDDSNKRAELDKISKEGLSPNSFKKKKGQVKIHHKKLFKSHSAMALLS